MSNEERLHPLAADDHSPAADSMPDRARKPKLRAGTSDQQIYQAIYDAVMDHRLPPGTKLSETSLSEYFGFSRTVIRKALTRLAHENIVCLRPNRGAAVASPSIEETREIFEARRMIENWVIGHVMRSATDHQLNQLRQLVREEQAACSRNDRQAWIRLSGEFHVRLVALSGNSVLAQFNSELVSRTSLILALYDAPGTSACAQQDHSNIVEAIAAGDEQRAITLINAHLQHCENHLQLDRSTGKVDLAAIFQEH